MITRWDPRSPRHWVRRLWPAVLLGLGVGSVLWWFGRIGALVLVTWLTLGIGCAVVWAIAVPAGRRGPGWDRPR